MIPSNPTPGESPFLLINSLLVWGSYSSHLYGNSFVELGILQDSSYLVFEEFFYPATSYGWNMVEILPWQRFILYTIFIMWVVYGIIWGYMKTIGFLMTFPSPTIFGISHGSLQPVLMMLYALNLVLCLLRLLLVASYPCEYNLNY